MSDEADDKTRLKSTARLEVDRDLLLEVLGTPSPSGCIDALIRVLGGVDRQRTNTLSAHLQEALRAVEPVFDAEDGEKLLKLYDAAGWDKGNCCRQLLDAARFVISREKERVRAKLIELHPQLVDRLQYVETSSGLPQSLDCRRVPWPDQPHLNEEPYGIEVKSAWPWKEECDKKGAAGEGVAFVLVDEGVDDRHPDFPKDDKGETKVKVLCGSENLPDFAHHGTKALGIVAAQRKPRSRASDDVNDGSDVTGIAYKLSHIGFSSVRQLGFKAYNESRAILRAIHWLHKLDENKDNKLGKVLLIERFMNDRSQDPIDTHPLVRCLIRLAVDCGVVVVIPAGNGQEPLPTRQDDSGAIIVGAAVPLYQDAKHKIETGREDEAKDADKKKGDPKYQVEDFSNQGPAVDCYAWGRCIRTTAFNGGYSDFDGTSGAAAIVAGIAALVQSLAIKRYCTPFPPCCVRRILREQANGIPVGQEEGRAVPSMKRIVKNFECYKNCICGADKAHEASAAPAL